jgi:hypothetical protein
MDVSNYQIGAFEALEWAWHMLRSYRNRPRGVDEARCAIQNVLANMGKGDEVNFNEKISKATTPIKHHHPPPLI